MFFLSGGKMLPPSVQPGERPFSRAGPSLISRAGTFQEKIIFTKFLIINYLRRKRLQKGYENVTLITRGFCFTHLITKCYLFAAWVLQ
jgi:hypothetical protein